MIQISNLSKKYGETVVFSDLNYTFENACIYGLVGRNGAGKTTLLNILSNYEKNYTGVISIDRKKMNEVSVKEFQTLVATGEVKHVAGLAAWARWMSREDEKIMEDHGLVSYNTDKYQEDHVSWWDCVDVISSSGYYPIDQWEQELDCIEKTVLKYRKPFFFAEA